VPVQVRVVSAEGSLYDGEADGGGRPFMSCPAVEGELGILPKHAPLLTMLRPGRLVIRNGQEETDLFVGGGFVEVLPERVTVLADVAERIDEITEAQAEEARRRAQELLERQGQVSPEEEQRLLAALQTAEARVRVLQQRRPRQ
jgi:F-type H+-transporting ATPase subunit epsilon